MKQFVRGSLCLIVSFLLHRPFAGAQCTGSDNTTSTGANAGSGGTSWTNPNSIQSTDGSVASVSAVLSALSIITTTTDYLDVTNLGLNVPSGNTICGVAVTINRQTFSLLTLGTSTVSDNSIQLLKGGVRVGAEHAATGVAWPTSPGTATYGGSSDLWGTTLTPADVNGSGFGVAISTKLVAQILSAAFSARIEQVTVTVFSQGILLPVGFQDFTARRGREGNILTWTEDRGSGGSGLVVVQRSADGVGGWQQLDVMDDAAGTGGSGRGGGSDRIGGSDLIGGSQTFIDRSPLPRTNFYRLSHLSAGGAVTYSPVKTVGGKSATSVRVYPNPFADLININSPVPFTRLVLRSAHGQTLWIREYAAGVGTASIPVDGLPRGVYFVQVDGTNYQLLKN